MIFSESVRVTSEMSIQHRKTVAMRLNSLIAALTITLSTGTAQAQDTFTLKSPDLQSGQTIPAEYYWNSFGCTGENTRPELAWTDVPEGTKALPSLSMTTTPPPVAVSGTGVPTIFPPMKPELARTSQRRRLKTTLTSTSPVSSALVRQSDGHIPIPKPYMRSRQTI